MHYPERWHGSTRSLVTREDRQTRPQGAVGNKTMVRGGFPQQLQETPTDRRSPPIPSRGNQTTMSRHDANATLSALSVTEHPITVLLIDDQPIIGEAVNRMLASEDDIIFHYCQDPIEGVRLASEIFPTVILQDLVMPDIDGLLLLRFFRANAATRDIPTIMLSVKEEAKLKAAAFAAGANDYLVKLPDAIELIARIRYHSQAYINRLQRDEAYQALQESEQRLRAVLENMPVMLTAFDTEGNIIVWNRECERITGYSATEILGNPQARELFYGGGDPNGISQHHVEEESIANRPLRHHYTPRRLPSVRLLRDAIIKEVNKAGNNARAREWKIACKDGMIKTVAWSNISDRFPIPGWAGWGIGVDITERKQAELAQEREYQQLRQFIKNAPIAMAMFDIEMRFLAHSNQWLADFNLEEQNLLGRTYYDVFPDVKDDWKQIHQQGLQGKFISRNEDKWERQTGEILYFRWAVQPWSVNPLNPKEEGDAIGGIIIVADRVDELIQTREAALEAARAKSQFLANMSHEIRTPMHGVLGMAGLILSTELNAKQKEYAETIRTSAKHLLSIINDILDFSKLEAGEMHLEILDFNIYECIKEVVNLFELQAEERGLNLSAKFESKLPKILRGDPSRLRQILLNLVSNAIKFTSSGSVKLKVKLESETESEVRVYFEVKDTGIGIPSAAQQKLFQSFSQVDTSTSRQYGGTGLGLAICQQLVQLMNGTIGVESQVDRGSKFWFTLEFKKTTTFRKNNISLEEGTLKTHREEGDRPQKIRRQDIKILVAEDHSINQTVILSQLEMLGYHADCANNGAEALEKLRSQNYDLVLMDCQMPLVDGYSATQQLRDREGNTRHTIVIALTAHAMKADRQKCLAAGMDDYLSKPVDQEDLARVIQCWLEKMPATHRTLATVTHSGSVESKRRHHDATLPTESPSKLSNPPATPANLKEIHSPFPVDVERLQIISRGKVAVQQKLLEMFIDTASKDLEPLQQAIVCRDYSQVKHYAHRLKGSAANMGVPTLSDRARELEEMAKQNSLDGATELFASFQELLEGVRDFVRSELR